MRKRARADNNQKLVTADLRRLGCFVEPRLSRVGEGVPDLLVAFRGVFLVVELKNPDQPPSKRRLTGDEKKWIDRLDGRGPVLVAETAEEIMEALISLSMKGWAE